MLKCVYRYLLNLQTYIIRYKLVETLQLLHFLHLIVYDKVTKIFILHKMYIIRKDEKKTINNRVQYFDT